MNRRALLRAAAATGVTLAGCLEGGDDPGEGEAPGDGSPTGTRSDGSGGTDGEDGAGGTDGTATDGTATDETSDEPTDGATETETGSGDDTPTETDGATETPDGSGGSNEVVDRSFEVGGSECGQGTNRADISRGDDRVDVDGTISGSNGCYTAELEDATYDDAADELTVAVRSYEDSDGGYCQQCIVDIDYRASVEFRDGTPGEVRVVHNGDHVTTG